MKIIFFGTPEYTLPVLKKLSSIGYKPTAIYAEPDKPVGRDKKITPPATKTFGLENGIPVFQPASLKTEEAFAEFKALAPDICVVAAYNKIIPARWLEAPKFGFINVHPSLLPAYRGPSPIKTPIMNGDKTTGVSIMLIDEQVDHGPILSQKQYEIKDEATSVEVEKDLWEIGADLLALTLPEYIAGHAVPRPQEHEKATFTKKFSRQDGRIDWNKTADEIRNLSRALNPEPGTWTAWNNLTLNIFPAPKTDDSISLPPGTVLKVGKEIAVACGKGAIILGHIQLAGKKAATARDFVNGHPNFVGSVLT